MIFFKWGRCVLLPPFAWSFGKPERVRVEVPKSKVLELRELIVGILSSNVVSRKSLRTLIGKTMSIASVIYTWRPFIHELYRALQATDTHAPDRCVWVKQIQHSLNWILSFLSFERGCIERTFSVQHFLMMGPKVTITWDASPYGMGATLQVDGAFTEFFAIPVSSDEAHILELEEGSKSQQTLEALCGLIALRLWCAHWQGQRAVLQVRSDNVGALNLFSVLKGSSKALTLIASEFAIDLGHAEFRPDLLTHLPGVTNQICDVLSRRYDPNKVFSLPRPLLHARAVVPPRRSKRWWKTLHCTSVAPITADQGGAKRPRCS